MAAPQSNEYDVVIVGAGPAGMAAALYAGRARLKTILLDRMGAGGGQLLNTELIEDYPGFRSITGADLAKAQEDQIKDFDAEIAWGEVASIEARGNRRVVRTDDGTEYVGKTVIVASGGLPKKLGVPGEVEFAGRGVSYCAICDGAFFKGKVLAVVGGGDSAVEEATFLTRYAEKVYVLHRRGEWRAQKLIAERALSNPKIQPIWHSAVEEILGEQQVTGMRVKDLQSGATREIPVGGVFIYVGFTPNSGILPGAKTDEQGFIVTDDRMALDSLPGVFVAGDVRSQYVRQIANAVGDATTAAVAATRYIEELDATGDPDKSQANVEATLVAAGEAGYP
ncbi:MAG: thioredoxin-disulfide reductase [Chloroflexi bacterium]|nr:thioredoxin-disulfide reductase [Chloroflexota bacterium]